MLFVLAYAVEHFVSRPRYRQWQRKSEDDPEALLRNDLLKNGAD